MVFKDRMDAGIRLAEKLSQYRDKTDVVVLGLPRGGMTVACQVAKAIHLIFPGDGPLSVTSPSNY